MNAAGRGNSMFKVRENVIVQETAIIKNGSIANC